MLIWEIVMVAMGAVRANLLRSVLTTLGIVIGIAAVITMVALGEGAQRQVQEEINRMGTTVLTIRPGQNRFGGVSRGDAEMSIDDAVALRAESGDIMSVSPEQSSYMQVSYMRWNSRSEVKGVWPEYFDIYNIELAAATSADPRFDGVDPPDVAVLNLDNDGSGITVTPASGLHCLRSGAGVASAMF